MSKDKNSILKKITQLTKQIIEHNENYHTHDDPKITDREYDFLYKELKKLEADNPEMISPESPTQRVGSKLLGGFKKVQHSDPMLSLSNASNEYEFISFYEKLCKDLKLKEVLLSAEPKFDGLAISIIYKNGKLESAVTRGDGFIGEDVTVNVKTIRSLPLILKGKNIPRTLILKAEIYMNIDDFNYINSDLKKQNIKQFANPRNIAAGTIRQLDPQIASRRNLQIFIHGVTSADEKIITNSHYQNMKIIKNYGFRICEYNELVKNINEARDYYRRMNQIRSTLPYEIDGIVYKVDDEKLRNICGTTSKSPKWSIAYKFKSIERLTKLKSVSFQVGRTGIITPVAELEPINIGGVMVSRASLHNMDEINKKDIRINDYVYVKRAGDVIPEIDRVDTDKRKNGKKIKMPTSCPSCSSKISKISDQSFYKCNNHRNCTPQIIQTIQHFSSRKAMNISGLGEGIIQMLIENNFLTDYSDLYYLPFDEVKKIDRMGELSSLNLQKSISQSKSTTLERLIYALGINEVGLTTAKVLASNFKSLELLQKSDINSLENIKDIGPIVAQNIIDFFSDHNNLNIIKKLFKAGIIAHNTKQLLSNHFDGFIFVITGSFKNYSRKDIEEKINNNGGKISSSVSKNTTHLVLGDKPGSKLKKAQEFKIKIIDETEFIKLLEAVH